MKSGSSGRSLSHLGQRTKRTFVPTPSAILAGRGNKTKRSTKASLAPKEKGGKKNTPQNPCRKRAEPLSAQSNLNPHPTQHFSPPKFEKAKETKENISRHSTAPSPRNHYLSSFLISDDSRKRRRAWSTFPIVGFLFPPPWILSAPWTLWNILGERKWKREREERRLKRRTLRMVVGEVPGLPPLPPAELFNLLGESEKAREEDQMKNAPINRHEGYPCLLSLR